MKYFQLLALLTALTCQTAYARCRRIARANPAIALQNIFPAGNNVLPAQTYNRRVPIETVVPANGMTAPSPYMRSAQKYPCQPQQPYPRAIPEIRAPEFARMQEIIRMPEVVARIPEMTLPEVTRVIEMPIMAQQYAPNVPINSIITPPPMLSMPEVVTRQMSMRSMPELINVQERFECPCSLAKASVNPFLPAASPVSVWAPPMSNMLPPITPSQARSNFLRKIPIPPPTL